MKKDNKIIEEQINKLTLILEDLNKLNDLDNENEKIKEQIKLIKNQIIDYKLELNNIDNLIPFKTRFINHFLKSKTVFLNLILIIFELLNMFTNIFESSNNEVLRAFALIIPALTIYLRTFQK